MSDNCSEHTSRKLEFYCMDPSCKESSLGCVLCIKNKHKNCKDDMVILKEESGSKIKILENQFDPKMITTKLNQILELKLYELNKSLMTKKKAFIQSFNLDEKPDNIFDPEVLGNIKKNFNFNFNE